MHWWRFFFLRIINLEIWNGIPESLLESLYISMRPSLKHRASIPSTRFGGPAGFCCFPYSLSLNNHSVFYIFIVFTILHASLHGHIYG